MFKFNIGDRVKILAARCDEQYGGYGAEMLAQVGWVATIARAHGYNLENKIGYTLMADGEPIKYVWDERLLRRVRKAKPPQPVEAIKDVQAASHTKASATKPPVPVLEALAIIDRTVVYSELVHKLKEPNKQGGICGFGVAYADGSVFIYDQAPCHAAIGGILGGKIQRVALLLDLAKHKDMLKTRNKETYLRYVEYIMARSPRANCFHYEGMKHAWEHGVFMNANRPIEELVGAAVALREGSEYYSKLDMFQKILDKGFSENVAYLLSYCVSEDMKWQGFSDAHRSLCGDLSFDGVIKFFKEGYYKTNKLKPYNKTSNSYAGITKWVATWSEGLVNLSLNTQCKQLLGVEDKDDWDYNPTITEENLIEAAQTLENFLL